MADNHMHIVCGGHRLCEMLCGIHGTMLPASTAERYHHIGETAFHKLLYVREHHLLGILQEHLYPTFVLKELYHIGIQTVELAVRCITAGVCKAAAVKHKTAAVAALVVRDALAEREACYLHR